MNRFPAHLIGYVVVCYGLFFAAHSQNNQLVPTPVCGLAADTSTCFDLRNQTITVGREVTSLGDLYKFCTKLLSSFEGKPSRIVLVLDNSGSMCGNNGNDPQSVRVTAANAFVDSVAANCSQCEIGVIVYTAAQNTSSVGTIAYTLNPLNMGSAANVALIHAAVNRARCNAHDLTKSQDVNGLAKITTTWTGTALDTAVQHMIDLGYDSLVAAGLSRHIILMTDGDWQTPVTEDIYTQYTTNYPGRPFPIIHGVYLQAVGGTGGAYDLTNMQQATQLSTRNTPPADITPGLYFPGTTPANIVATFDTLFRTIVTYKPVGLEAVTFTNTTVSPPQSRPATVILNTGTVIEYTVRVPAFDLQFGANTFVLAVEVKDTAGVLSTTYDTLTIVRNTTTGTGTTTLFNLSCRLDTVPLSITCAPTPVLIPNTVTVSAKAAPSDTNIFAPNTIMLRAFVPFPDDNDASTLALFHLDNNLANTAPGGAAGAGTPAYSSANAAFGSALSGGSFTTNLALPIGASGNFTVECWIKPAQAATIVSGAGFKLEITSDNYLSVTIGSTQIKTNHVIDLNVWQHVAVARVNGSANLYINGIPMATAATASGSVAGTLTIGPVSGGLDEVRISSTVRSSQIQGKTVVQIPLALQLAWNISGASTTGQTALLPFTMWQAAPRGQAQFQFSSTLPGPMIINFFDTSSSPLPLMWSKNGDPVLFTTTAVTVSAALRDSTHEGHLDMIDLTWPDSITVKTPLPGTDELIATLVIRTLDNKWDTLHASALVLDAANKTLHIMLRENNTNVQGGYETGWLEAKIVLTDIRMTIDGRPFVVGPIIDAAAPVPASACYAPAARADSLYITFSEPLTGDSSARPENMLRYLQDGVTYQTLQSFGPSVVRITSGGKMLFVFPYTSTTHIISAYSYSIGEQFPRGPKSPVVPVDYCYAFSLIDKVKAGPNPVVLNDPASPIITITSPGGTSITKRGVKIEVTLTRPTTDKDNKQIIEGSITIFDAVGNTIQDKIQLLQEDGKPVVLSTVWDGTNKKGMYVAGGTYLARVTVRNTKSNQVETGSPPTLIGVKTKK